jgi:hypothetical protein
MVVFLYRAMFSLHMLEHVHSIYEQLMYSTISMVLCRVQFTFFQLTSTGIQRIQPTLLIHDITRKVRAPNAGG